MPSYPPPTTRARIASLIVLLLDLGKRFGILGKTLQMGPFALFGDIPESMECQSPLAQVDRKFHDLVTGRWLSVASTSEPGDEPAIFLKIFYLFFFHCTIQQPRIAVQYSVIVEGNLMLCHQHHPHYDHFAVNLDPTHQATMEEPYVNIVRWITLEFLDDPRSLVLQPHGFNPWEDAALPPHELNRWEDCRHEHLSCHHMHSSMGRTLDLPPHELNHGEVHCREWEQSLRWNVCSLDQRSKAVSSTSFLNCSMIYW